MLKLEKIMGNKILVLGANGMVGHTLFQRYAKSKTIEAYGTVRNKDSLPPYLSENKNIIDNIEAFNFDAITHLLAELKPDVVINCIGIIKQLPISKDPIISVTINSLLPHKLAKECGEINARFIHISTDCVFSGRDGNYTENCFSDAEDLYGKSKFLGEVHNNNSVTIRTSVIGHELSTRFGLLEWFLSEKEKVRGFQKAIFSGFTTIEFARLIEQYIIPNPDIKGLYHISAEPVSKYDLISLIAHQYDTDTIIEPDDTFIVDRSLNSSKFRSETGYIPPPWDSMIENMYKDYITCEMYKKNRSYQYV
jgi:dTDP-4-dehydrorhamnose reductase